MKKIIVHNNLNKTKEELIPHSLNKINIYTCGPTVYDHSHIGHARSSITWDFIVRFLRFLGYTVNWTRNITDIDDKIINKAKELNLKPDKVSRIYTHSYHEDMNMLGVEWPDYEPQATQYLPQMFNFIEILIKKKHAYVIDNDVYFSVSSFKDYGKLKGQTVEELEKGIGRIESNEKKKHKLDFALWKGVKDKNEYSFDSPWGKGRPGWHLECSAMNFSIYDSVLDIHGGGDDLIFPHHENEIAQSEAFLEKPFAKYWLHNGMIMVDGKKMAKSEGNFVTIKDSLKEFSPNAIRLFILNTHYRMPLNYTKEALSAAENGMYRLKESLSDFNNEVEIKEQNGKIENEEDFISSMCDDFNSPKALAVLFGIVDKINVEKDKKIKIHYQSSLIKLANVLGIKLLGNTLLNNGVKEKSLSSLVDMLLNWRTECKANKDYTNADKIRDTLSKCNIEVKDLPDNKHKWQIKV